MRGLPRKNREEQKGIWRDEMYRVYLIDDEPWVLIGLERLIAWEELGFRIVGKATSSRTAWAQIEQLRPDVVFTDIRMPGLTGLELLKQIREAGLSTEVVLISGFAEFQYAQTAVREGAFDYLVKPIKREQLTDCLQRMENALNQRQIKEEETETLNAILKYKENCTVQEFMEYTRKQKMQQETYAACLVRFPESIDRQKNRSAWSALTDLSIVQVGSTELFAVGVQRESEPQSKYWVNRILHILCPDQKKRAEMFCGVSLLCEEDKRVTKMLEQAEIACDHAAFTGKPTVFYHEQGQWEKQAEMLRQAEYHQNSRVREYLEELKAKTAAGEILLDELWRYSSELNRTYMRVNEQKPMWKKEYGTYRDILLNDRTADNFFAMLTDSFFFDTHDPLLNQIREIIESRYMENGTAADLAAQLGISQGYFSQIVKREMGKSYSELILERRLKEARNLLKYTDCTVGEIAEKTGYSDYYYFTKTFKKLTGMSPSEYRKSECQK